MTEDFSEMARQMVREAQVEGCPGSYVATGHSSDHVSIIHQQVRCIKPLLGLSKAAENQARIRRRHRRWKFFRSMSLAVQRRRIVYIYEERPSAGALQAVAFTNVNSRDLPVRYSDEIERFNRKVISALCWSLTTKE